MHVPYRMLKSRYLRDSLLSAGPPHRNGKNMERSHTQPPCKQQQRQQTKNGRSASLLRITTTCCDTVRSLQIKFRLDSNYHGMFVGERLYSKNIPEIIAYVVFNCFPSDVRDFPFNKTSPSYLSMSKVTS